jgi:Putative lumazine-binding
MSLRHLVLLALSGTTIACTVSPIPASTPAPTGTSSAVDEPEVREVVGRHFEELTSGSAMKPEVEISSVDVTGDIAAVKVVETYARAVNVDYLHLARDGGEWRIVHHVDTHWAR